MDNILTYVKWRGDIQFYERSFNDVDALIFATLAYAEWDGIVGNGEITLSNASQQFMLSEDRIHDAKRYTYSPEVPVLVGKMIHANRYKNVIIKNYKSFFNKDEEVQFAAVTFVLEDGTSVIAYRGTDSSILGWKEDFHMTYKEEIPAQKYALTYFKEMLPLKEKKKWFSFKTKKEKALYLVGHSKGGNLAMYTAIKASEAHSQITRVYNFDGPGFLKSFYDKNDVSKILSKIKMYLPSASIIGRLLEHKEEHIVIEGYDSGLMQHSAFRWQVKKDGFVKADALKPSSDSYIAYIDKVLLSKSDAQKEKLISAVFSALEKLNIDEIGDMGELSLKQALDSVKEFGLMSNEDKRFFLDCLRFIMTQTKNMIFTKKVK